MFKNPTTGAVYAGHSEVRAAHPEADLPAVITPGHIEALGIEVLPPKTLAYASYTQHQAISNGTLAQLASLAWRLERAQERDRIGAEGETVAQVMVEREAVRRASNRAEAELAALTTVEEIEAFTWEVLPEDWPALKVLTKAEFLRAFTGEERAAVRAAREAGDAELLDFWELLQISTQVDLHDADTIAGVRMLETHGLISEGRADEILLTEGAA